MHTINASGITFVGPKARSVVTIQGPGPNATFKLQSDLQVQAGKTVKSDSDVDLVALGDTVAALVPDPGLVSIDAIDNQAGKILIQNIVPTQKHTTLVFDVFQHDPGGDVEKSDLTETLALDPAQAVELDDPVEDPGQYDVHFYLRSEATTKETAIAAFTLTVL
eukprot:g2760.t1